MVGLQCISYRVDGLGAASLLRMESEDSSDLLGFPLLDPNAGGYLAVSPPPDNFPDSPVCMRAHVVPVFIRRSVLLQIISGLFQL